MKNKFITFEGIDGSGKSLQIEMLADYLTESGEKILVVREPGTTTIGEHVRNILMDKKNNIMSYKTEALLFMAARAQLMQEKIIPALENNYTIICDRFIDSSVVYQGIGRGLGEKFIKELNKFVTENIEPDITFFLDISPQNAWLRKIGVQTSDRFEYENINFHQKIYLGYKKLITENPNRIICIDANVSPEEIHTQIVNAIKEKIKPLLLI